MLNAFPLQYIHVLGVVITVSSGRRRVTKFSFIKAFADEPQRHSQVWDFHGATRCIYCRWCSWQDRLCCTLSLDTDKKTSTKKILYIYFSTSPSGKSQPVRWNYTKTADITNFVWIKFEYSEKTGETEDAIIYIPQIVSISWQCCCAVGIQSEY